MEGSLFQMQLSVFYFNSYYPSGDAFASGSDDATVSNQSFTSQNYNLKHALNFKP